MNLKKRATFGLDRLSRMQLYIGEEIIEKYEAGLVTGSMMLRSLILIGGSAVAAAALLASTGPDLPKPPQARALPDLRMQPPTGPLVVPEDDPAVYGEMISFENGHTINGYIARPKVPGPYPGVIVIHEAFGLSDHTKDIARRLAKAGFIAFAPDLLSRWGISPDMPLPVIMGNLGNAKPEEIVADLNASTGYLQSQPDVTGNLGVVGFCFGGGYSLNLAAHNPKIKAAICYYGVTPQPASQMAGTQAAILSHYGANDARVNASVPELEQVLAENGKTFEKHYYEGAGHGFNNDTVANMFNEQSAVTAWQRSLDWFERYLKN